MDNDQHLYDAVKNQFWYYLQIGGVFLNYQPKWKIFSMTQLSIYIGTIVYLIMITTKTIILALENKDLAIAAQSIHFTSLGIVVLILLSTTYILREDMCVILNNIARKYYSYGDTTTINLEDQLNKEATNFKIKLLIVIPLYMMLCAVAGIIIAPIADKYQGYKKEKYENGIYMECPVPMWFPYLVDNDVKYLFSLASQALGAFILAVNISAANVAIIFFTMDFINQLKILNYSIKSIEERAKVLYEENVGNFSENILNTVHGRETYFNFINSCLKQNIEHHKVINESYCALRNISKWPMMLAFLIASLVIALSVYTMVNGGTRIAPQLLSLLLLLAEICDIFILCWQGQILSDQSENLFHQIYNLKWFNWNESCKLSLMIIRERYKKPMVLSGGGMIASNYKTFSDIMSSAYSYFQLIYAFEIEK